MTAPPRIGHALFVRGFGAIGVILAMFFVAVLVLLYLRTSVPSPDEAARQSGAVERARDRAAEMEEVQRRRLEQVDRAIE